MGQKLSGELDQLSDVKWLHTTKLHSPEVVAKTTRRTMVTVTVHEVCLMITS